MIHFNPPFKFKLLPGTSVIGAGVGGGYRLAGTSRHTVPVVRFIFMQFLFYRKWLGSRQRPSCLLSSRFRTDTLEYLGLLMPAVCGALACQGPEVPIASPHSKAVYMSDQPKQQLYFAAFKGRGEGSP